MDPWERTFGNNRKGVPISILSDSNRSDKGIDSSDPQYKVLEKGVKVDVRGRDFK